MGQLINNFFSSCLVSNETAFVCLFNVCSATSELWSFIRRLSTVKFFLKHNKITVIPQTAYVVPLYLNIYYYEI